MIWIIKKNKKSDNTWNENNAIKTKTAEATMTTIIRRPNSNNNFSFYDYNISKT